MGPAGQLESSESRKLFHGASVITTFNGLLWKVFSEGLSRPHEPIEEQEEESCNNKKEMWGSNRARARRSKITSFLQQSSDSTESY